MKTMDIVGVWALGTALVLALVGVVILAAIGRPIPNELWAMITMVGGALAGVVRGAGQSSSEGEARTEYNFTDREAQAAAARRLKAEELRRQAEALEKGE